MNKCRYCELKTPKYCSGQIEDHCTWCGLPCKVVGLIPSEDRFCSSKCKSENNAFEELVNNKE